MSAADTRSQPSCDDAFDDLRKLEMVLAQRDANADHARLANANLKDCLAANASLKARIEELEGARKPTEESLRILIQLMESIGKHGNYSDESTIHFIDQAAGCLRAALEAKP